VIIRDNPHKKAGEQGSRGARGKEIDA